MDTRPPNIPPILASLALALSLGLACAPPSEDATPTAAAPSPSPALARLPLCPEDAPLPFQVPPDLYPFEPRCFDTPFGWIRAVDTGPGASGETLLFVHGNPSWSLLWAPLMAQGVAAGHRVIALDHLGYGRSAQPLPEDYDYGPRAQSAVLESMVTALDLREITLIVHDWGGPIGLGMAGRHPERIARLLVTNTWAWPIDPVAPGRYHRLWDWSTQAHAQAEVMTDACVMALYTARWLAEIADPERGSLYAMTYDAYAAPWIDPLTGALRHPEVCSPTVVLAQAILDAPDYLAEVAANLPRLAGRPVSFVFGQGDDLLGALRCDVGAAAPCPAGLTCVCDPDYLDGRESCESAATDEANRAWVCQRGDGSVPMPALEDLQSLLGEQSVVGVSLDKEAEHFVPAYPLASAQLLEALERLMATPKTPR